MTDKKEVSLKGKARGLLGFFADFIQVLQFVASLFKYGLVKAVVAATVIGGASYAGVKIYEQQVEKKQEVVSPTPTVALEEAEKAVSDKNQIQNDIQETFTQLVKKWSEGDMVGVLALTDSAAIPENAQELERHYNRILLNWKVFDDVKLLVENAYFQEEGKSKTARVPFVYQGVSSGEITFINKGNRWFLNDFLSFLNVFSRIHKKIQQEISYTLNDNLEKVGMLDYTPANSSFSPYYVDLYLGEASNFLEGQVYLGERELVDSELSGKTVSLSESAVMEINKAKATELKIKNIKSSNPYTTIVSIQEPIILKL